MSTGHPPFVIDPTAFVVTIEKVAQHRPLRRIRTDLVKVNTAGASHGRPHRSWEAFFRARKDQ